ncbi:MAG: putative Ig domain-containing protein, partial [Puniceicoccaceae bacterium]
MKVTIHSLFLLLLGLLAGAPITTAAPVIVNEYNAVRDGRWLAEDGADGSDASDSFFGRIESNGGDWFELVVVGDGTYDSTVDMRGWTIEISDEDEGDTSVTLANDTFWEAVPAGTILTFIDKTTEDGGLDTAIDTVDERTSEGWAWTNIYVGDATYVDIEASFFADEDFTLTVANKDTQITIKDSSSAIVFGPVGEGANDISGVNSREVLELRESPSPSITEASALYEDTTESTFGAPNSWEDDKDQTVVQSFRSYRTPGPAPIFTVIQDDTRFLAGDLFSLPLSAIDTNGGEFTFTAPSLPSWLTLTDNEDGTGLLEGTPSLADVGTHPVELQVADDPSDGTDSLAFEIEVFPS